VFIVALGVSILLGGRAPWLATAIVAVLLIGAVALALTFAFSDRDLVESEYLRPLNGMTAMDVDINFGAGTLRVTSLADGSPNAVDATLKTPGEAARASLDTPSTGAPVLRFDMPSRRWASFSSNAEWDIALARTPRLKIDLDAGASDLTLDLRDLKATEIDVDVGAADLDIILPARAGDVTARVGAGASSIKVTVPDGVAARVRNDGGLSSFDIDETRFPKSGQYYVSPNFDTSTDRVTLEFHVGVASVDVR
jgi:hypothetical protein